MVAKQITVFIENRTGRLGDILDVLKENGVNIISMSLSDTSDYGLLRVISDKPQEGKAALSAAGFSIDQAHTLSEIEAMSEEEKEALIIPTEKIFEKERRLVLSPFFARLARCGVEIYLKKIGESAEVGEKIALYDKDGFFALGEVREFEGGRAVKPIRQFDV